MAKVIWKYEIPLKDDFIIEMPKGAHILKVAIQGRNTAMWAVVDPAAEKEKREFFQVGTGDLFTRPGRYIDTYSLFDGDYIFHLFEAANTG
jgi:hypothetical protein